MTNPPNSLSPRPRKLLRRGGIALVIYTIAVLVIVPWENVGLMLLVPGYPLILGLCAYGWVQLARRSSIGKWLSLSFFMTAPILTFVGWVRFRSLMSETTAPTIPSMDGMRAHLWILVAWLAIGMALSIWGWVLCFRAWTQAKGSVIHFERPFDPVGEEDWNALR